jgi:outer membrane lipoprotein-sorting protein
MRSILGCLAVLTALAAPAAAAPDAQAIIEHMKTVLEPGRPSVRQLTLTVSAGDDSSRIIVGEARKRVDGAARILLVALAPAGLRDTAYLVQRGAGAESRQWVYLPAVRRVRTVVSPEAYSAFLNSDFTYADLGFVREDAKNTFLGTDELNGDKMFKVQSVPAENWYYGRWVTWVDADTWLPVQRELYDAANVLWKREEWKRHTVINGVRTVLEMSMEDVQAKTRTDIKVTGVAYDVDLPDALFAPGMLPAAGAAKVWAGLGD